MTVLTPEQVLEDCRVAKLKLRAEENNKIFAWPVKRLTPELEAKIKAVKAELCTLLLERQMKQKAKSSVEDLAAEPIAPTEIAAAAEAAATDARLEAQRAMVIAIGQITSNTARAAAIREYCNSIGVGLKPDGAGALLMYPNGSAGPLLVALVESNAGFIGHCFNIGLNTARLKIEGPLYEPQPPPTSPSEWDLVKTELIERATAAAKVENWAPGHITKITARLADVLQEGDRVGMVDFFAIAIEKPGGHVISLSRFDD